MAEKDITSKILMSYADVFADCINTLVYNGMRRLSVEETQPAPTESDVHLAVYHMKNLPKETRQKFVSDMGFVVEYLNEGNFEGRRSQKIVHLEALCEMMEAITGDTRFTEQIEELYSLGRDEDAKLAVQNKAVRTRLYEEFCIAD